MNTHFSKLIRWLTILALLTSLLTLNAGVVHATTVGGAIMVDTTWTTAASPYVVTNSVLVLEGVTLTIQPGVVVYFNSHRSLQVDGQLIARGTDASPITFTSSQSTKAPGDWGYILFSPTSVDAMYDLDGNYLNGSILQYTTIEYAGGESVTDNGALRVQGSAPFLDHTRIQFGANNGIRVFGEGFPKMTYNTILSNAEIGIYVTGGQFLEIIHNTIQSNRDSGIWIENGNGATVNISYNTINDNKARYMGGGIYSSNFDTIIQFNTITENFVAGGGGGGGISIVCNSNNSCGTLIADNIITGNSSGSGGGINSQYGNTTITRNIISDNSASRAGGVYVLNSSPFSTTVSGNTFKNNSAGDIGGGLFVENWVSSNVSIAGNIFLGNYAGVYGGAIYVISSATIERNIIVNNSADSQTATSYGGGIFTETYGYGYLSTITSNVIADNYADYEGGINGYANLNHNSLLRNEALNQSAGAIYGDGNLSNNTIVGNKVTGSGPIEALYINGHPTFNNNNVFGNPGGYAFYNGAPQGSANLNAENTWWGTTDAAQIQAMLYDWFDDSSLGMVDATPYRTVPNLAAPLSPPAELSYTTTLNSISLNWAANPEGDVAGYKVYWDTGARHPYAHVVDVGKATGYTIDSLTPGTYYVAVTAYDADADGKDDWTDGNESWYSVEQAVNVLPPGFSKTGPANTATGVTLNPTLTWGTSTGAAGYEYCYDTTADTTCTGTWTSTATATTAALTGLNSNTTYYWQVRAVNAGAITYANEGAWWSFTTLSVPPAAFAKTAPANAATGVALTPTLTWETSTGAVSYEYCYDTTANTTCTGTWTSTATATTADLTGLSNNTTYYWQVRAINADGTTYADGGTGWSFTTLSVPPAAFAKTNPPDAATAVALHPTLTWETSTGAASYEYCYDTTADTTCTGTWTSTATTTTVDLSGLSNNTTYYWQVRAINAGDTTYANEGTWWSFTTLIAPPAAFAKTAPANAAAGVALNPTLTWDTSDGTTSYEYCYDTTNDNACNETWISTTTTTAALTRLSHATTYYWQVRAINADGTTYANGGTWWSFTTLIAPPAAFAKISPTNAAAGVTIHPTLTWETSSGATSYEYCYDTTNDTTCTGTWTSTGTNTIAPLTGLNNKTTYYWQVRAVNASGTTYANGGTWWKFATVAQIFLPKLTR
jgi:parallel beta-helix repeat protein